MILAGWRNRSNAMVRSELTISKIAAVTGTMISLNPFISSDWILKILSWTDSSWNKCASLTH